MSGSVSKIIFFIFLLLVCSTAAAQTKPLPGELPRQSQAGGTLFRCLFDKLSDAEDSNGWPDHWTRKEGFDNGIPFPTHLVIGITEYSNPFGNYALRMNMEGGAAAVFSPKIPIRAGMSYTISAYTDTDNLVFDDVFLLAAFYSDDSAKPIRTIESRKIRHSNGWQQLVIGPVPADMPKVKSVAIGLLVMPTNRQDYGAKVNFTNVEIRESPTVALEMANENHLFFTTRELDVRCQFRGLDPNQHSVTFILEDPFERVIAQKEIEMMIGNHPASRFIVTNKNNNSVIHGTATWKNLPIRSFGFYRIRVATPPSYIQKLRLPGNQDFDDPLHDAEPLTFAVMPPSSYFPGGEFGWSLDDWSPEEIVEAVPTLTQSGLSHLKLPVWISSETPPEQREMLIHLCNNLSEQQVHLVGLLNPVPKTITEKIPFGQINASSILGNNPALWGESLQLTLQSLSLLIKDWQWTSDTDQSLIDLFFGANGGTANDGTLRFQAFQKLFDQHQFGFGIGLTWNWNQELPDGQFPFPNFFLNFPADSSLTPEDASSYLAETPLTPFRRSVSVAPLSSEEYALDVRVIDFVQRLILMKASGIDSIYLTAPRNEQTGVLRRDGTPNELYLPWRTTTTLLSGSRLLGKITMPNRSENYCFDKGGGKCVMVVWNELAPPDKPVYETLYLGNEPEIIDVWGKHTVPEQPGINQTIPVSQTPVFVTGLNANVVRFRLRMETAVKQISSVPNQAHTIPFSFKNESAYPVSVQISPMGPREGDWIIQPPQQTVNLETGVQGAGSFDLTLTPRGDTGQRQFQYNVKITGTEPVEFAVYNEMLIGNPDVYMEFMSRLNEKGEIEVMQTFVNNSEQTYTYDCRLTIPDRPMQKTRITRQGFGRVEYVYTIKRGQALIDSGVQEMLLRAQPLNDGSGQIGEPMVYTVPLITN